MYRLIQQHTEINLNELPKGSNLVNFSMLNSISAPLSFRSFSIKLVLEGRENYFVNGNKYSIHTGEYLLANSLCEGRAEIDSPEIVKGICIDVSNDLLSEVFAHTLTPDTPFPDLALDRFFTAESFLENRYTVQQTKLGAVLSETAGRLNQNPFLEHEFTDEFYYTLAEKIVEDHLPVIAQLNRIDAVRQQTRKDLYRKLCRGKEFLDHNLGSKTSILNAAQYAGLSEYHFFRLFKSVFHDTPQQYLIKQRLNKASLLLGSSHYSITEAAFASGFADVSAFSKSFKKHYGSPPSLFYIR